MANPDMITVVDNDFARGSESARRVAEEWELHDFSPDDAAAWIETARCWDAGDAATLRDAGLTPKQCAQFSERHGDTLGYAFANGDLSLTRLRALLAEGE
jgi:hypothetical protein